MSPSFDHKLDNFEFDKVQLKQASTHRVFRACVVECAEKAIYKACCVVEARMLAKYRDLAFYDPDDKVICTVYSKNMEWVKKLKE